MYWVFSTMESMAIKKQSRGQKKGIQRRRRDKKSSDLFLYTRQCRIHQRHILIGCRTASVCFSTLIQQILHGSIIVCIIIEEIHIAHLFAKLVAGFLRSNSITEELLGIPVIQVETVDSEKAICAPMFQKGSLRKVVLNLVFAAAVLAAHVYPEIIVPMKPVFTPFNKAGNMTASLFGVTFSRQKSQG